MANTLKAQRENVVLDYTNNMSVKVVIVYIVNLINEKLIISGAVSDKTDPTKITVDN